VSATAGKREATKAANRAAILDAAREVFAGMGFGAASVRDIVRRTDLATGTFYNYFPDKEAVFGALLEEAAAEARSRIREAHERATTAEEFVRFGFEAYFEFLAEDQQTFDLVRRNAGTIRAEFDQPALGASVEEVMEDLRAGIEAGYLPEHDVEYMAAALTGAGFEVGVRLLERDGADPAEAVDFLTHLFTAALESAAAAGGAGR
jgi:AcrR family transcriptional regulator